MTIGGNMDNPSLVEIRKSGSWTIALWSDGLKTFSIDSRNVKVFKTVQRNQAAVAPECQ
jgi:hypothetical protein